MKGWPIALLGSILVMFLQLLTFGSLLGRDVISRVLQILLFGPFLCVSSVLRFVRDSWDVPIPATLFGGFPGWLTFVLLALNWAVYSLLLGVTLGRRSAPRRQSQD